MESLSQVMNVWRDEGYNNEISIDDNQNAYVQGEKINPEELKIDKKERFEGQTNPSDMSILFAVSHKGKKLGLIVDSYSPKEETVTSKFLQSVVMS